MEKKKNILVILGMHRSGTSVLTRIFNLLGADPGGNLMRSAEDNQTGFWEPTDIVEAHDELLKYLGYSWSDPRLLPYQWWKRPDLIKFKTRLCDLASQQYSDIQQPIIKDPRLCRLLPIWQDVFDELDLVPHYVHVARSPLDVAASLAKRDGISLNHSNLLWLRYIVESERWSRGSSRTFLFYDDLLENWETEVKRCQYELVQKRLVPSLAQKSEINSLLDTGLRHNYIGQEALDNAPELSLFISEAYFLLQAAASGSLSREEIQPKFDAIRHNLQITDNLYSSIWSPYIENINSANDKVGELEEQVKVISADLEHNRRQVFMHKEKSDSLKEKVISLADKSRRSEVIADQLGRSLGECSANFEALERNLSLLQNDNSELKFDLARSDEKLSVEIESAKKQQIQFEATEKKLLDQIEIKKKENARLSCGLAKAESTLYELEKSREADDILLKSFQDELDVQADELSQYRHWMHELNIATKELFLSKRWRVGEKAGKLVSLLKMRRDPKTAKEHMLEILSQHDDMLNSESRHTSAPHSNLAMSKPSHWDTLYRLVISAMKNPSQTAKLLNARRVTNFLVTIFKQDPYYNEGVYEHYLRLYHDSAKNSVVDSAIEESYPSGDLASPVLLAENPKVSIIIPVFNQWKYTRRCIDSIIHNIRNHDEYEIILADDNSSDETINAQQHFNFLVISKQTKNVGFLLNCNNAASMARGEYIVFLNNDTVVHKNWLQELICVLENDLDVGMVGSKLIYPDNKLQEAGGIIWDDASGWNYGRLDDPEKPEYNYVREVDYISGASIMVRTALWNEIGGFDERYVPAYYEDTDLAFAVRNAGYKVVFTPFSVVTHFEGQSHGTDETAGIKKYQSLNKEKFVEKWSSTLAKNHFPNGVKLFRARDARRASETILVIDHYVPEYDRDAGSRSTYQYLRWFVQKGLIVKFIGDNFYKSEPYTTELQKLGIEVLHGSWYANNWQKWLEENGKHIDYAYLHRPHIAPKYIDAIRKASKAKIIFFGHDLHYLRIQRQSEVEKCARLADEAKEWKDRECAIFNNVDVAYYPSYVEVDEIIKQNPTCLVRAIPLNIMEIAEEVRPFDKNRRDLLFVGGFNHKPNVDAIKWFVSDIFPLILQKNNDIKLNVVGSKMPRYVRDLSSNNIIIHGEVSDQKLESLYDEARISVVPLRYGAGIKGKVLEALQHQVPVVTTPIGSEGLEDAEIYLSITDDPCEFTDKIMALYTDDKLWSRQVENGVEALNDYFSDERVSEILGQDITLC